MSISLKQKLTVVFVLFFNVWGFKGHVTNMGKSNWSAITSAGGWTLLDHTGQNFWPTNQHIQELEGKFCHNKPVI